MSKQISPFTAFLNIFPEIELPISLGENTHMEFSRRNDPLPGDLIQAFIVANEKVPSDEFTEHIACFRVANLKEFQAVVYWRAGLMDYRYILATFNKKGEQIDSRVIAGMFSDGEKVTTSVATIDKEWGISVASGQSDAKTGVYDPEGNTLFSLEIMPDGTIENE